MILPGYQGNSPNGCKENDRVNQQVQRIGFGSVSNVRHDRHLVAHGCHPGDCVEHARGKENCDREGQARYSSNPGRDAIRLAAFLRGCGDHAKNGKRHFRHEEARDDEGSIVASCHADHDREDKVACSEIHGEER